MQTFQQLTQSHLCVVVLDQDTHNPIARMPIYAEVSIVSEVPRYQLTDQDLGPVGTKDFFRDPILGPILRSTIARLIDEAVFLRLGDARARFIDVIIAALSDVKGLRDRPESEIRLIVETSVLKAMDLINIPRSEQQGNSSVSTFPLGFLATDHAGYASFDLTRVPKALLGATRSEDGATTQYAFFLYPMGEEAARYDALEQRRFTRDAIFAKLAIAQPIFTPDLKILNLPSMQKPSLVDWYFSPGSFAAHPDFLVGADGCENLLPAQLALQEFNFRQVVRLKDTPPGIAIPTGFRFGYVDEYRASWYSLGHALGEIQYSLPLAPGESVKLAVIDWSWDSTTQRTEDTKLTEQLLHETHRDRTITETVKAALQEWQRGGSLMGGVAGSYSGGNYGVSAALGGAYATSSGSRDLAAENVQKLNDSFAQASSSQRELYSTVVIQARQEEKESIQTRTFTNYNHGHTLTILYYEVLRHFKVVVEWTRRRPAVLVNFPKQNFDEDTLLLFRNLLEENLLDVKLKPAFDVLEKLATIRTNYTLNQITPGSHPPRPFSPGDIEFKMFELMITTSHGDTDETDDKVVAFIRKADGTAINLVYLYVGPHGNSDTDAGKDDNLQDINLGNRYDDKGEGGSIFVKPEFPVMWRDIAGFEFEKWGTNAWRIERVSINAIGDQVFIPLVSVPDSTVNLYFRQSQPGSNAFTAIKRPDPDLPTPAPAKTVEQNLSAEETHLLNKLTGHIAQHRNYYSRLIVLNRDPNDTAVEFETVPWAGGEHLIDHAEPYPLEVFGDYIAYPFTDPVSPAQILITDQMDTRAEKLITLPTRGVFAEGKLGHCNIAEEIDNTRFWKWEEHPLPIQAPDINPVTPVAPQPQQINIAPTPFPTSLVNIVNPTVAPDPVGLAAALKVLGTPNIFRDMSGIQEVSQLLQKLSDNATGLAKSGDTSGSGSAVVGQANGGSSTSGSGMTRPSPTDQHDQLQVLRNAQQHGDITDAQKNQLAQNYLQDAVTARPMLGFALDGGTAPTLDPGNFKRFVDAGKLDLEIADVLRALDEKYPVDSWAKQTAVFAYHELDVGNLLALVTEANRAKVQAQLPSAFATFANVSFNGNVTNAVTVANVGSTGAYKGFTLMSNDLVARGMAPGPDREKLALVITHELMHFRNRDYGNEFGSTPPSALPDFYVDVSNASSHTNTQGTAGYVIWEVLCNHVSWHVQQDLRHLSAGTPILANPDAKGFFRYALALDGAGWPDNGYLADLKTAGTYNRQIAIWLQKAAPKALFHDDPTKNQTVRQFIQDMYNAVQPGFQTPTVPADGGA